jgi:hypothetical protein
MPRTKDTTGTTNLQGALDAAGIHNGDPTELADRINELRFIGPCFVSLHEYPRRAPKTVAPAVVERNTGGARLDRVLKGVAV